MSSLRFAPAAHHKLVCRLLVELLVHVVLFITAVRLGESVQYWLLQGGTGKDLKVISMVWLVWHAPV